MKNNKLIGKTVKITDNESIYYGHWGVIQKFDDYFHVSGVSISTSYGNECTPVFDRNQFKIIRRI